MPSPELDYCEMPDAEAAAYINSRLMVWAKAAMMSHTELGLMCRDCRNRELWKLCTNPSSGQPFTSWSQWMRSFPGNAYSTLHQALRDITFLTDIPDAELAQVRQENVETLKGLSTAVRNDTDVLAAAKTQHNDIFRKHIRENHPDQHVTDRKAVKVMCEDPDTIYSVLDQAVELHEAIDRGHALEMIAAMARKTWELEADVELSIKMEAPDGQAR